MPLGRRAGLLLPLVVASAVGWVACTSYDGAGAPEDAGTDAPPDATSADSGGDAGVDAAPDAAPLPLETTIATKQGNPGSLALTSDAVYWLESVTGSGAVVRDVRDGGAPALIVQNQDTPTALAVLGGKLAWVVATGNLQRADLDGNNVTVIRNIALPVDSLVYVAGYYWHSDVPNSSVDRGNATDGTPVATAQPNARALVTYGTDVVFARDGAEPVARVSTSTAAVTPVGGKAASVRALATDAANVYAAVGDDVLACKMPDGTWAPLAQGVARPWALATFGGFVYAVSFDKGLVYKIPASGGAAQVVGGGLSQPTSLVVDADGLYVASTGDGRVVRFDP